MEVDSNEQSDRDVVMSGAHGQTQVTLTGQLIEAKFSGAFNPLGIKEYASKVAACLAQLDGQPFIMLIDNLKLEGGTPEAYQALDKYNTWLNEQNLVAKAMVITSEFKAKIIGSLTPSMKQQNLRHFVDREQALTWLELELSHYPQQVTNKAVS